MAGLKDLLLDANGDIQFKDGLLVFTQDATEQNQRLLLLSNPGDWKEHPTVGVGLKNYLLDDLDPDALQGEIQSQFEKDGMRVLSLEISSDFTIAFDAEYVEDNRK